MPLIYTITYPVREGQNISTMVGVSVRCIDKAVT
jgi:hypothetical protein